MTCPFLFDFDEIFPISKQVPMKTILICLFTLFVSDSVSFACSEFTTCLYDGGRQRPVPVAVYQPETVTGKVKVIIFSHGYGQNDGNSFKSYSFLTRSLADKGYCVISIQHELPQDPPLSMEGDFMKTRMPHWENGVANILFIIQEFKKLRPGLDWNNLALMGHSNGGDMSMLFASKYPEMITKAISLDHRRMIIPRIAKPRILTLRGCDYEADKNVIPTLDEQRKYHIGVIPLAGVKHGDMDDKGSREQHERMLNPICDFLEKGSS